MSTGTKNIRSSVREFGRFMETCGGRLLRELFVTPTPHYRLRLEMRQHFVGISSLKIRYLGGTGLCNRKQAKQILFRNSKGR